MAKIFTPDEVRARQIPEAGDFETAGHWLLDNIASPRLPFTEGALVFGSTVNGSPNPRSDLDVLVSHTANEHEPSEVARAYEELFIEARQKFNVPIEAILYSTSQLRAGKHTIDPLFRRALTGVDESLWSFGFNPVKRLAKANQDWVEVYRQYVVGKEKKFKKAIIGGDTKPDYKVMQRALELPSSLGRKTLGLLVELGRIEDEGYHMAPKPRIIDAISRLAVSRVIKPLRYLDKTNLEYTEALQAATSSSILINEYEEWIHSNYNDALDNALNLTVALDDFTEDFLAQTSSTQSHL